MAGEARTAKFTQGKLMRHVITMSLTGSVGLMAIFIVDFVDLIFIGMLGNVALAAAVGYAGTLLFIASSFSIGLSIAAGVLVSRALGAGDTERARISATNVLIWAVSVTFILGILMYIFMDPALRLVGARGETLALAKEYMVILVPTSFVMSAGFVGNALLRAYGDAKRAMYATLAGGVVNAIFDPIFIFGFGWGLEGAALASLLSRFAIVGFSCYPVWKIYQGFARPQWAEAVAETREIASLAVPAVLTNIATPFGAGIFTRFMSEFGDSAVAAAAVIGRLTPVAFAVVFALSGAVGPIIGQNAGAGLYGRVRGTYRDALIFSAVYVLFISAVLFLCRGFIADLFDAGPAERELIYLFCGPLSLGYFFMAMIYVCNACFNNLGHPFYSTFINWGRNTLGMYPLVALGAFYWGAKGVLVGQIAGAVVFAALAHILAMRVMREPYRRGSGFRTHERGHVMELRRR